jgi:FKBP-type peptidyl-prolyl cis-trans isomerase FklB
VEKFHGSWIVHGGWPLVSGPKGEAMQLKWLAMAILLFSGASSAQEGPAAGPGGPVAAGKQPAATQQEPVFKTVKERISYAIGADAATGFRKRDLDLDPEALVRGFLDVYSGKGLLMSGEEIREALAAYQKELVQKSENAVKALAEKNKKEGEAFLAENKTREGVVTLPSGLQYKILKAGKGSHPTDEDTVEAHYRGNFIDGREFDSSYKRGQPATFNIKRVIPGWKEALKLMPVGSRWQLVIPPELAYGARGMESIEPNAVLIFEVELLAIKPPESGGNQ